MARTLTAMLAVVVLTAAACGGSSGGDTVDPILERSIELGVPAADVARQIDEATRPLFARAEHP